MPKWKPRRSSIKRRAAAADPGGYGNAEGVRVSTFDPKSLQKAVVTRPLLDLIREDAERSAPSGTTHIPELFPVIIDLNLDFPKGRKGARDWIEAAVDQIVARLGHPAHAEKQKIDTKKSDYSQQYLFGRLQGSVIVELVRRDRDPKTKQEDESDRPSDDAAKAKVGPLAIHRIWLDFKVNMLINKSISTVKADAAHSSFSAHGEHIVWAVLDSGIDGTHPHFQLHKNLNLEEPLQHMDFTTEGAGEPLVDKLGHGTHVAGIIAGELRAGAPWDPQNYGPALAVDQPLASQTIKLFIREQDEHGEIDYQPQFINHISGIAPKCKLLSVKVLDDNGDGLSSTIIQAIGMIQEINGHGRRLLIHGVNMSVGYNFEPEWFACGQSPLCVEVNRLVRSGVVVVVAAGNTGYAFAQTRSRGTVEAGLALTINDPGNADLAITVGSTHRDKPHMFGVSFFSSKGPTGDGRLKPDLVAPGEKIISCAAGAELDSLKAKLAKKGIIGEKCQYLEQSGTSMAAPHVSGVIAAFLSIRREFIGNPERVKEIFLHSATDLKRERYFQGHGLVDLMRALQSI